MKKTIKDYLGLTSICCVFAACMITDKAGDPCIWNFVLLGAAVVTGLLSRMKGGKCNG